MSTAQSRLKGAVPSRENVEPVWYAVGAVLLDRAVTLPFWGYEANPLVAGMGKPLWLAITALLIGGLLVAWYPCNARQSRAGHVMVAGVVALHLFVVVANLGVVTGVL